MKTKQEIKQWLLDNATDREGNIDLGDIDFGDRIVYLNCLKAGHIVNIDQEAKIIFNTFQKAEVISNYKQEIVTKPNIKLTKKQIAEKLGIDVESLVIEGEEER